MPTRATKAGFIDPMLLLRADALPEGANWAYELKLDGYRALAIKTGGQVRYRSRNDNDFNARYPAIVKAMAPMPDETVIDGEIVALDEAGRPSFSALQNHGSNGTSLHFFIFDVLILGGRDVMDEPLTRRRELIEQKVLPPSGGPDPVFADPRREPERFDPVRKGTGPRRPCCETPRQ